MKTLKFLIVDELICNNSMIKVVISSQGLW